MNAVAATLIVIALATASDVGAQENVTDTEPRALDPAADPANRFVEAATVPGLIVSLAIDGGDVTLERAQPARIPRPRERRALEGDTVTITGLLNGQPVASVTVPDQTRVAVEEVGAIEAIQRSVHAALPTPRAIDAIEVRVSATGATARFDVRPAYAELCRALPDDPVCAALGPDQRP